MGLAASRKLRKPCHGRGQESRQVHDPRPLHDQDQDEACQEGWHQGRLRQDHQGEGCASQEDCEGLLHLRPEEEHLKWMISRNGLACRYESSSRCGDTYDCRALESLRVNANQEKKALDSFKDE